IGGDAATPSKKRGSGFLGRLLSRKKTEETVIPEASASMPDVAVDVPAVEGEVSG
ncbi:unnamed protein product, partial [Discosporangium mesarthrocarpum]